VFEVIGSSLSLPMPVVSAHVVAVAWNIGVCMVQGLGMVVMEDWRNS
jgi:hypothetical protein